jgi:hypothetical protein
MTKEELEKLEVEAIKRLSSSGLILKYKGIWFWKKCPECDKKIKAEKFYIREGPAGSWIIVEYKYYSCSCGWEYAQ